MLALDVAQNDGLLSLCGLASASSPENGSMYALGYPRCGQGSAPDASQSAAKFASAPPHPPPPRSPGPPPGTRPGGGCPRVLVTENLWPAVGLPILPEPRRTGPATPPAPSAGGATRCGGRG